MWTDLGMAILLVLATGLFAVGVLEYLVTKDFFFPYFLSLARRFGISKLIILCFVTAVLIVSMISLSHWQITRLSATRGWDMRRIWSAMETPSLIIVLILFLLSIYSFGVMIDRALMYSAARKQSRLFVQQVAGALRDGNLDEAIAIAERNKKSHIAKVVATGLSEFQSTSQQVSDSKVIDAAKRGLERSVVIVHEEMRRGLSTLANIGSIAPFVGLFGTVVGILNAFKSIETSHATGFSAVVGGIAEALITTAFGLLVAVPAVWAYNYFANKVEAFDVEMGNSSVELINYFILRRGEKKG